MKMSGAERMMVRIALSLAVVGTSRGRRAGAGIGERRAVDLPATVRSNASFVRVLQLYNINRTDRKGW